VGGRGPHRDRPNRERERERERESDPEGEAALLAQCNMKMV
jgi:hypothetical protein